MRKFVLSFGVGLAALAAAPSAQAQAVVIFQQGSASPTTLPGNARTVWNGDATPSAGTTGFDPGATAAFTANGNTGVTNTNIGGVAARPAFYSEGNYGYVGPGGSATFTFAAAQVFSFILGSLDIGNTVELSFANGNHQIITGASLLGPNGALNGNQTAGQTNGRVTFDAQGGSAIVGATFTSGVQAFEYDDLASAAPEPATWLMMIMGFGMIGAGLRRSRPARKLSLA